MKPIKRHDLALMGARAVLGGYLAAHGAQKLFGSLGGRGIEPTAAAFEGIGLRPGRFMATTAGVAEFGGGVLTLAGLGHPLGPVALVGTMAVASTTHRANGPFSANRGYELPLTNLVGSLVLATAGPGRYSIDGLCSTQLPRWLARLTVLGCAVASANAIAMLLRFEPEPPVAPSPRQGSDQAEADASK
jgi:putative oxidoreductase